VSNPPSDDRTRIGPWSKTAPAAEAAEALSPGDFAAGDVIGGHYRVLALIGRGGMGSVYRVHHVFLDKEQALKTLSGNQITEVAWKRFNIEAQVIARLDHPNIIRIYDLGISGKNQPYYVMDLVDGISLAQMIDSQGALKPSFALPIFRQVSAGLAYAHERGIIHRDLKPANIMLVKSEKPASTVQTPAPITAKILDFGLAKLTDLAGGAASGLTKTGEIFGSPLYMSPEQAQGLTISQATDMYSFGCTLFETLTGQVPLKGQNAVETMLMHQTKTPPRLSDVRPDLAFSPELEYMTAKLLAKNPQDRYRSFAEIANQLLLLEKSQTMTAPQLYALDTRTGEAGERQQTGEYTNPPPETITSKKWFWPGLAGGLLVFTAALAAGSYSLMAPSPKALPVAASPPPSESGSEPVAPTKLNTRKPFSHIAESPSGPVKVFDFPDKAIGIVSFVLSIEDQSRLAADWEQHNPKGRNPYVQGILAQGAVSVPLQQAIDFNPFPETCNTPGVFKQFRADDFYQLDLTNKDYVNDDFMPYIKHLTKLHYLFLDDTDVGDKSMKVIDNLTGLDFLSIDRTKISGGALSRSAVVKHLRQLSYAMGSEVDPLIKSLEGTSIVELRFNGAKLTSEELGILARLPALKKLSVNHCGVGDAGLKIIATSKTIRSLDLEDYDLTAASIPTLAKMKLVKLAITDRNWSSQNLADLRVALAKQGNNCNLKVKTDSF
jgi:serine/threonine-protein kinase